MDSGAGVMLYQPDYDELNKIAKENNTSIAKVVSDLIKDYKRMISQPQPHMVFQQMNMGEPVDM